MADSPTCFTTGRQPLGVINTNIPRLHASTSKVIPATNRRLPLLPAGKQLQFQQQKAPYCTYTQASSSVIANKTVISNANQVKHSCKVPLLQNVEPKCLQVVGPSMHHNLSEPDLFEHEKLVSTVISLASENLALVNIQSGAVTTVQRFIPDLIDSSPLAKHVPEKSTNSLDIHTDLHDISKSTLPDNYEYKILSVDPLKVYRANVDQDKMFQAILRLDIRNKADAEDCLQNYKMSSSTDWRVRRTFPENTAKIIFKKQYRCHNNTHSQYRPETKNAHYKQTECKATITITIKNSGMKRTKDTFLRTHPLEIVIDHFHNHPLSAADSLRHRRPNPDVKEKFLGMFRSGHSPSSALRTFQYDLQVEHGENFWKVLGDGALCPSEQWCYHQYYKQFGEAYGDPDGAGMVASLQKAIDTYNADSGSCCAAMKQLGEDIIIVLCTPLMKRVHKYLKSSSEMTFLDSGGSMDRQNTRVFTFLAPSVAGALPTGILLTSSESQVVISEGMKLLQSILPADAFYGRGAKGPLIGMTDDSASERNSLRMVYPDMTLLLCYFHILQAYWRYVMDSKHKVAPEHRLEVFFLFKQWCRCETEEEFQKLYQAQLVHQVIASNKFILNHLKDMYAVMPILY